MHLGRAALCVALAMLSSCTLDTYILGGGDDTGDGGLGDGGSAVDANGTGHDGSMNDAPPDGCIAFPETCNHLDDDCDGDTDEDTGLGGPAHCGDCNIRCDEPNTAGTCDNGTCEYECLPGYVDPDGDITNGCNYFCSPTNNGVEICDLTDNDCDLTFDEGLDLTSDEENCGQCGRQCFAANAEPICENSICGFGDCDAGFADVSAQIPGCEYACPTPIEAETCDGVDEDCDGATDELPIAGLGDACADPGFEAQMGVGRCTAGFQACSFGVPVCSGFVRPLADDGACNDIDDDCDGPIDEDVDFNDPRHCGGCAPCALDNAIEGCPAGSCTVIDCFPGFTDANGLPADGCEYACTPTGPETCDGVDNDCDTDTDEDVVAPSNFCADEGACTGTLPSCVADLCTGDVGWTCEYGPAAELDLCGALLLQEESCDDMDGDCDGNVDESFEQKGDACEDNGIGVCQRTGELVCAASNDNLTCNLTSPVVVPSPETCDNRDEDCDTRIDEGAPDTMVEVTGGPSTFYIYKWEASRPDATAVNGGSATARSCSKPGVRPWRNVSKNEAAAACASAGKRLCTEDEWELSCGGVSSLAFPYGDTYGPDKCNGRDVDLDCTGGDSDEVAVTGRGFQCPVAGATQCVSPSGAIDMSGNLREWTSTAVGDSAFRVRGGGYDNIEQGLRCDLSFIAFSPSTAFPNLGFRCCSDTP